MGSLSKLAPECAICSRREKCNHKRMAAEAYIEQPLMQSGAVGAAQPLFVGKIGQVGIIGDGEPLLRTIADSLKEEELPIKRFMNYGA